MSLFSGTISTLEHALNYASTKQKVISNNIANAETPNYKAKEVSFSNMLSKEVQTITTNKTDSRHFDFSSTSGANVIVQTADVSYNNSGNSVDIDKEMSDLATNQIYYNAVTERIASKFQSLQNVIKGGK
ncbi:MAG: flagellar basal body rod protein FlgB [Bacillus sp. (in: firmicutes)]